MTVKHSQPANMIALAHKNYDAQTLAQKVKPRGLDSPFYCHAIRVCVPSFLGFKVKSPVSSIASQFASPSF